MVPFFFLSLVRLSKLGAVTSQLCFDISQQVVCTGTYELGDLSRAISANIYPNVGADGNIYTHLSIGVFA